MAQTVKELIDILANEDPDTVVVWQYYTAEMFDYDEERPELTQEDFAKIADKFDGLRHSPWDQAHETLSELVWEYQKGQEDATSEDN